MMRTPLLSYPSVQTTNPLRFAVERWLLPTGDERETVVRLALIWDEDDRERVVLLAPMVAATVANTLMGYAADCIVDEREGTT